MLSRGFAKKPLLLCLGLLWCLLPLLAFAQDATTPQLRIEGQGRLDGSAVISNDKRDANGRQVAAIKVLTNLPDLSFESANGVVDLEAQTGEYVVFVSPNERKLTIRAQGFLPLEIILSEFGIRLESGQLWELTVTGEQQVEKIPVNFVINPDDAGVQLFVDGDTLGSQRRALLAAGNHKLRIQKANYKTIADTITVSIDQNLFSYELEIIEAIEARFTANQEDVRIVIDGQSKGTAPVVDYLVPGTYFVEWRKEGYLPVSDSIQVTEGGQNRFNRTLMSNTGRLRWQVEPSNARVTLNKVTLNSREISRAAGNYVIEIEAEGYIPIKETIQIERDQTIERTWTLQPYYGRVQISTAPANAKISISQGSKLQMVLNGAIDTTLQVGRYMLEVSAEGYQRQSQEIQIKRDQIERTRIVLTKTKEVDVKALVDSNTSSTTKAKNKVINPSFVIMSASMLNENFSKFIDPGVGFGFGADWRILGPLYLQFEGGGFFFSAKSDVQLVPEASGSTLLYGFGSAGLLLDLGRLHLGGQAMQGIFDSYGEQLTLFSALGLMEIEFAKSVHIRTRYGFYSSPEGEVYADIGLRFAIK